MEEMPTVCQVGVRGRQRLYYSRGACGRVNSFRIARHPPGRVVDSAARLSSADYTVQPRFRNGIDDHLDIHNVDYTVAIRIVNSRRYAESLVDDGLRVDHGVVPLPGHVARAQWRYRQGR